MQGVKLERLRTTIVKQAVDAVTDPFVVNIWEGSLGQYSYIESGIIVALAGTFTGAWLTDGTDQGLDAITSAVVPGTVNVPVSIPLGLGMGLQIPANRLFIAGTGGAAAERIGVRLQIGIYVPEHDYEEPGAPQFPGENDAEELDETMHPVFN